MTVFRLAHTCYPKDRHASRSLIIAGNCCVFHKKSVFSFYFSKQSGQPFAKCQFPTINCHILEMGVANCPKQTKPLKIVLIVHCSGNIILLY